MNTSMGKHVNDSSTQPAVEEKGDVLEIAASYTPEEEKQVLRKIDGTILPLMCVVFFMQVSSWNLTHSQSVTYIVQYLDKQSLSYASVSSRSVQRHALS
jgi:hypothetical protein